jgi:hypothetical protein
LKNYKEKKKLASDHFLVMKLVVLSMNEFHLTIKFYLCLFFPYLIKKVDDDLIINLDLGWFLFLNQLSVYLRSLIEVPFTYSSL